MNKRGVAAVSLLCLLVAPVQAELKYTMKMEARPSTQPATAPPNPLLTMLGGMVLGMIAPPGGIEMTVVVGDLGMRVEYSKAYAMVPAGAVMLVAPDGAITVLDAEAKTYWKTPRPNGSAALGANAPTMRVTRTGASATVAGVRADHATVDIKVALPIPPGMAMPGLPSDLAIEGEAWFADRYKQYAMMSGGLSSLVGSLGLDKMSSNGFMVRSIMRSDLFAGQQIESLVTSLAEVAVPPTTFQVPTGFTEVQPPAMSFPGAGR